MSRNKRTEFEKDPGAFPYRARVRGYEGIAFHVLGWHCETAPNEWVRDGSPEECFICNGEGTVEDDKGTWTCRECDGEGSITPGYWSNPDGEDTVRDGFVAVVMVGDDRVHLVDHDDISPLKASEYCHTCGQIGCGHNVPDEEDGNDGDD